MEHVDASDHFEQSTTNNEQTPSLLVVVLDTNPAAWALLSDSLPLSNAVANLLVFINAHLACNYTNKVAVIASHCDRAQWLFPTPSEQTLGEDDNSGDSSSGNNTNNNSTPRRDGHRPQNNGDASSSKRARHNHTSSSQNGFKVYENSNKYRPFRMVEEQLLRNLTTLLTSTKPSVISSHSSTMVAGALTLGLSYINRETIAYNESLTGKNTNVADTTTSTGAAIDAATANNTLTNALQARILLVTVSPSTDLAHQYIPIMNSIFACQRLNIPIDVLHLPLPSATIEQTNPTLSETRVTGISPPSSSSSTSSSSNSTVFLQQAADATHGIFISAQLTPPLPTTTLLTSTPTTTTNDKTTKTKLASSSLLTYLLTAFLPSPNTRRSLILPTRIDVDFRAACFCHRNIISTGFVCSICLSIFCAVPEGAECLTCGTQLTVQGSGYGARPVVVPRKKKKKQQQQQQRRDGVDTSTLS